MEKRGAVTFERGMGWVSIALTIGLCIFTAIKAGPSPGEFAALVLVVGIAIAWGIVSVYNACKQPELSHAPPKAVPTEEFRVSETPSPEIRISFPVSPGPVSVDPVIVRGTCAFRPEGKFLLWTRKNFEYWPHGDLVFSPDGKSWSASARVNVNSPGDAIILVTQVTPEIACMINYYNIVGQRVNWQGIPMPQLPAGIKVYDEVTLTKLPS